MPTEPSSNVKFEIGHVMGDHRGQSQQSRLELGLHLSRRFSPVSVRELSASPRNFAFPYAYLFCRVAIFLRKPSTATKPTKPIARRPSPDPPSGTAVVT